MNARLPYPAFIRAERQWPRPMHCSLIALLRIHQSPALELLVQSFDLVPLLGQSISVLVSWKDSESLTLGQCFFSPLQLLEPLKICQCLTSPNNPHQNEPVILERLCMSMFAATLHLAVTHSQSA